MKIAIIGASGFTGMPLVEAALKDNHLVYAISRKGNFKAHENLVIIHEDINNYEAIQTKIQDADIIISNFNAGWENPNLYTDYIKGSKAAITLAKSLNKRIIIVGGASSLYDQKTNKQIFYSAEKSFQDMVKGAFDLYEMIKADYSFDWTFVSPPLDLNGSDASNNYNIGSDYVLFDSKGNSSISVYDLADFLLLLASSTNNNHKRVTLANR